NQSVSAKQVKFFRNGDQYFSGLRLAVSIDRYKEFESLLTELSSKLNLPTGAVRYLFNADDGSLVSDVSQLQNGISYVCSSSASFRQIEGGYGKLVPNWSNIKRSRNIYRPLKVLGNIENSFRLDSSKDFIKPKLVTVIRNGKPPQRKVTLLLNNKTAISLDQVLDQLSAKGSLGKVDKLHTTSGKPIRALRDLFDDTTVFIALSTNEKFPDDGIELDPNSYRITPYREMKKSNQMAVRRSNSLRHNMRYKDENENMSLSNIRNLKNGALPKHALSARQSVQPRIRTTSRKEEQKNKEELYPTSVFASDSESDDEKMEMFSNEV
uniref:Doublecortin domain-containing protein n=1 Tax=Clytia hemisphaerica TaxID=252671 RepID=A0A7M6DLU1_9CNID